VETIIDAGEETGIHNVVLSESNLASGIYFYEMRIGGISERKKLLLLK
jgi:hypothetical protein